MKSLTFTQKILVLLFILDVAVAAMYAGLFLMIKKAHRTSGDLLGELQVYITKEARLRGMKEIVRDTETDRLVLDRYFVSIQGIVDTIKLFESIGKQAGVFLEIKNVTVVPNQDDELTEFIQLDLGAAGSWVAVYHFLSLVESVPYKVQLDKVHMRKLQDTVTTSGQWNVSLILSIVKLKQ